MLGILHNPGYTPVRHVKAICVAAESNKLGTTESDHSNPIMNANWTLTRRSYVRGRRESDRDTNINDQIAVKK